MAFLRWFVGITFALAFVAIIIGSPIHKYRDLLFWFMTANTFGLVYLCVLLHNEPRKDERAAWIRVFILADWLFALGMAVSTIWKSIQTGRFW